MAVSSTMVPLGTEAPDFRLPDLDGHERSLDELAEGASALLVMFLCNHCPYVRHVEQGVAQVVADYRDRGLVAVGICANDQERYPDDRPEGLREQAERAGFDFAYLLDADQQVAKAYGAACTPDFFLFDADRRLAYRGQLDDSRPDSGEPVTGADLRAAIDAVLDGRDAPEVQRPSIGCGIKWSPGNEPQ